MKLSAVIMAHPVRQAEAEELQASLDRPVDIIYDTNPTPSADPRQRWANGRKCWEAHDPDADWHLVIQDDAIASPDLLAGLEVALDQLGPDGLVSPYTGTGRPDQRNVARAINSATQRGHSWLSTWSLCWGVAIAAPVHTIPGMLQWCSHSSKARLNYDLRIGRYYRDVLGWRTWYTHPSLVDHRDSPSLVGHGRDRHAHRFHHGSALDIPWGAHDGLDYTVDHTARRGTHTRARTA